MLKLDGAYCAVGYAGAKGLKHGIGRTNPYNARL